MSAAKPRMVTSNNQGDATIARNNIENFKTIYDIPSSSNRLLLGGIGLRDFDHANFFKRGREKKVFYGVAYWEDSRLEAPTTNTQVKFYALAYVRPNEEETADTVAGWRSKDLACLLEALCSMRGAPAMGGGLESIAKKYSYRLAFVQTQLNGISPWASTPVGLSELYPHPILKTLFGRGQYSLSRRTSISR